MAHVARTLLLVGVACLIAQVGAGGTDDVPAGAAAAFDVLVDLTVISDRAVAADEATAAVALDENANGRKLRFIPGITESCSDTTVQCWIPISKIYESGGSQGCNLSTGFTSAGYSMSGTCYTDTYYKDGTNYVFAGSLGSVGQCMKSFKCMVKYCGGSTTERCKKVSACYNAFGHFVCLGKESGNDAPGDN